MERGKQPIFFYLDTEGGIGYTTEYEVLKPDFLLTYRVNYVEGFARCKYIQSIERIETREKITAESGSVWRKIIANRNYSGPDKPVFMSFDESEIMLLNWNKPGDVMRYSLIDDSKQEGGK